MSASQSTQLPEETGHPLRNNLNRTQDSGHPSHNLKREPKESILYDETSRMPTTENGDQTQEEVRANTLELMDHVEIHSARKTLSFLDLPWELRRKVYLYIVPLNKPIEPRGGFSEIFKIRYEDFSKTPAYKWREARRMETERMATKSHNIYYASKLMSEETLKILYNKNTFELDWFGYGGQACLARLSERNRQNIQRVCIIAPVPPSIYGGSYAPRRLPTNALWSPIIPNLKKLQIVLRDPVKGDYNWSFLKDGRLCETQSMAEKMQMWYDWLRSFLGYFAERLPNACEVQVDMFGGEDTDSVLVSCLGSNFKWFAHPWPEKLGKTFERRFDQYFFDNDKIDEEDLDLTTIDR